MPTPITQADYNNYTQCLDGIKIIEQCYRKKQTDRISVLNGWFVKDKEEDRNKDLRIIFENLTPKDIKGSFKLEVSKVDLKDKIDFINNIHRKLQQGELKERNCDDCAPLAAAYYNARLKTILAWNDTLAENDMVIELAQLEKGKLSPAFTDKTIAQAADEKSLMRYFELLDLYPKLKREGELNDYKIGTYQIIYEHQDILSIRQEIYERLYNKAKAQNLNHSQADELAINYSRPGVVCEDHYWLWIRDIVIAPNGYKHTYNRIIWKSDLDKIGGVATLPILVENDIKKIVVQLVFRHATNSWEFEIARGVSKDNETSVETAKRETLEETGYVTDRLIPLCFTTPDSGLTASIVPIYLGQVIMERENPQNKKEAIKGKYAFTFDEIMKALNRGHIEVQINDQLTQVPIRDPFLAYALLIAQYNKYLD